MLVKKKEFKIMGITENGNAFLEAFPSLPDVDQVLISRGAINVLFLLGDSLTGDTKVRLKYREFIRNNQKFIYINSIEPV
jgi:hypothetical protein